MRQVHQAIPITFHRYKGMGATEDAIDAAAHFLLPFFARSDEADELRFTKDVKVVALVEQAIAHLQAINQADLAADPTAPYDISLFRIAYGLLDLVVLLGILPNLSPEVAFSQRPKSILTTTAVNLLSNDEQNLIHLSSIVSSLMKILKQGATGVQPLLSQRILPDVVSALAELSFNPASLKEFGSEYSHVFKDFIADIPILRLLSLLTTYLQQPLPPWLRPIISQELSLIPLRKQGVRFTIEFLAMSCNAKNHEISIESMISSSSLPIPAQAVEQASRLLVLPAKTMSQDEWFHQLAPQLLWLLDGNEGKELGHAAALLVAGILSKRKTGAPGQIGWELFARPLLDAIYPQRHGLTRGQEHDQEVTIVSENDLKLALQRLLLIVSSYSNSGLIKRMLTPLLLPIWAIFAHSQSRRIVNQEWTQLPGNILRRYFSIECDIHHWNKIASNLFWDGPSQWTYGPGSTGGIEIRLRQVKIENGTGAIDMISRISQLDQRINALVSLLLEASVTDDSVGAFFVGVTQRWLNPLQKPKTLLVSHLEDDPFGALIDAKLSQVLATKCKDNLARSPVHVISLMGQLIASSAGQLKAKTRNPMKPSGPTSAMLSSIFDPIKSPQSGSDGANYESLDNQDFISFALSIVTVILSSPEFKHTKETEASLKSMRPHVAYLSEPTQSGMTPVVANAASALFHLLESSFLANENLAPGSATDPLSRYRVELQDALKELTSSEPPDRSWALRTLHGLIEEPEAFVVVDVPSLTHALLSASLADPESYVHTAAGPVIVGLARKAPHLVVSILVDVYLDVDEQTLGLNNGTMIEDKRAQLEQALDFRLRVGEVLDKIVHDGTIWEHDKHIWIHRRCVRRILETCLSLASRRGRRVKSQSTRATLTAIEQQLKVQGKAAWEGPTPSLYDQEAPESNDTADLDNVLKTVQGWAQTGLEEDLRIRASALSLLSAILEYHLPFVEQPMLDAALQVVMLTLTLELSERSAIVRRASVLVVMGLLRAWDSASDRDESDLVRMTPKQQEDVERIMLWVKSEDTDALVRDHATNVVEGFEALRVKSLYKAGGHYLNMGPTQKVDGALSKMGIGVTSSPLQDEIAKHLSPVREAVDKDRKIMVEEIE